MSTSKPKRAGEAGETPPLMEMAIWALFVAALLATAYVLVNEPEEGPPKPSDSTMANYAYLAWATAGVAASLGVWQILREGGRRNLFGMAVLFSVVIACFWALRFMLV